MYIVKKGAVGLLVRGELVETVAEGGFFGAMVDRSPRSATAVAKTDCSLIAINEKQFLFNVQEAPLFAVIVMRTLTARLRKRSMGLTPATERDGLQTAFTAIGTEMDSSPQWRGILFQIEQELYMKLVEDSFVGLVLAAILALAPNAALAHGGGDGGMGGGPSGRGGGTPSSFSSGHVFGGRQFALAGRGFRDRDHGHFYRHDHDQFFFGTRTLSCQIRFAAILNYES